MLVNKNESGYFSPSSAKLNWKNRNKQKTQTNKRQQKNPSPNSSNKHTHAGRGNDTTTAEPSGIRVPNATPGCGDDLRCPEASGAAAVASSGLCVLRSSPPVIPARRPGPGGRPGRSRGGPGTTKLAVKPPGGGCICCPVYEVRWLPGPGRSQCCCGH